MFVLLFYHSVIRNARRIRTKVRVKRSCGNALVNGIIILNGKTVQKDEGLYESKK